LNAISCRSASLCVAVGAFGATRVTTHPYSQIWNGTAWRVLVTPGPAHAHVLNSVSCASRTNCVAIGEASYRSLFADAWNGRRWRVLTVPSQAPAMNSVSCPTVSDCMAVGSSNGNAVAAEWDGKAWQALTMPAVTGAVKNGLGSVSCARSTSCIAVGSYTSSAAGNPQVTLAEAWNGATWTTLATPAVNPVGSVLSGVSCAAAASCVAVGLTGNPFFGPDSVLAEGWDGHSWTVLPAAVPTGATSSSLSAVSCASGSNCVAVGGYSPPAGLAESWNGTTWKVAKTPRRFSAGTISCPAAASCMAAGGTLAEQWNGSTWRTLRTLRFDSFSDISCTRRTRCMAVGGYVSPSGRSLTLAERWNGRSWLVRTSLTPARFHTLSDVSCAGSAFCMALGVNDDGTSSFAEEWDGRRWRLLRAPPAGLARVSCPTTRICVGVGRSPETGEAIAAAWNGRRWRQVPVAVPKAFSFSLADVSCLAATRCVAVGSKSEIGRADHVVAEQWNGRSFQTFATHLLPPGDFYAVDCTGRSRCMAVGRGLAYGSFLAAQWNGRTWRTLRTPSSVGLSDVSCASANDCLAVGSSAPTKLGSPGGAPVQIAEHWNGQHWALVRTPTLGGALSAVSCVRGPFCVAVSAVGGLNIRTLAEQWNGIRVRLMTTRNP